MGRVSQEPDKTETGMERPREETDEPHPPPEAGNLESESRATGEAEMGAPGAPPPAGHGGWGQEDRAKERQSWGETEGTGMGREREIQPCMHGARSKTKTSPPKRPAGAGAQGMRT